MMTEVETERDCPACGSESVQRVRDGEREPAPHVRDEFHPPDRRCLSCGERWNPANRPPELGTITRGLTYIMVALGALAMAALAITWAAVMYLLRYGDLTGPQRRAVQSIARDPLGILAAQFTETILYGWPVLITGSAILMFATFAYLKYGELERRKSRGGER